MDAWAIDADVLRAGGYTSHGLTCTELHTTQEWLHTTQGWVKRFRGEGGTRFFLFFTLWAFHQGLEREVRVSANALLYVKGALGGEATGFRVDASLNAQTTLAQVEAFYLGVFEKLGCICDPYN